MLHPRKWILYDAFLHEIRQEENKEPWTHRCCCCPWTTTIHRRRWTRRSHSSIRGTARRRSRRCLLTAATTLAVACRHQRPRPHRRRTRRHFDFALCCHRQRERHWYPRRRVIVMQEWRPGKGRAARRRRATSRRSATKLRDWKHNSCCFKSGQRMTKDDLDRRHLLETVGLKMDWYMPLQTASRGVKTRRWSSNACSARSSTTASSRTRS